MMTIRRLLKTVAIGCASGVLLVACASTTDRAGMPGDSAVMCSKCKMIWVEPPYPSDPEVYTYVVPGWVHECPDCREAVLSFFRTGKFEHTCASCGDALVHCTHPR